jgi:hypothetical protein
MCEPFDDASITSQTIPKPRVSPSLGISLAAICLLVKWDPAYRWQESASGSNKELGKSSSDVKGKAISVNREMRNTDALEDGGSPYSSVEAAVMAVEQRG